MAQEQHFSRKRTCYDEYPDYTRPPLEIPGRSRERMLGRLEFLYGPESARRWMSELERILTVHHAHKPPEMIEKEQGYDPRERFCQEDIREKKRHYDLMFDAVLNHCSSRSEMFQEFLNGDPAYADFFIAYESPDDLFKALIDRRDAGIIHTNIL